MLSKIVIIMMALGAILAAPTERTNGCLNDERFIETNEPSWVGHCGIPDVSTNIFDKTRHYRHLADKIKRTYDHTLEFGTGDLEEYHKWRNQFEFLPKIDDAIAEEDFHQHLQTFAATFQFLQKVQYRYHIQTFPQLFGALEQQALRILCAMENNPNIEWHQNRINKEKMNEKMCKFNLGSMDKENQNFRNARFTQLLFRQYLDELHQKIMAKV